VKNKGSWLALAAVGVVGAVWYVARTSQHSDSVGAGIDDLRRIAAATSGTKIPLAAQKDAANRADAARNDAAGTIDNGPQRPKPADASPNENQSSEATATAARAKALASARGTAARPQSALPSKGAAAAAPTREQLREQAATTYGAFLDGRSLDATAKNKVLDAIADYQLALRNSITQMMTQGGTPADIAQLRAQATAQYNQQVTDVLGGDGIRDLNQFGYTQQFVPLAQDFAARCAAQGVPISPNVVTSLAQNFSQNLTDPNYAPPDEAAARRNSEFQVKHDALALEQASRVLTPQQLELFKQLLAEHPWYHH